MPTKKKAKIRYDLAKDQSELTWEDFERFPVWLNCLELEDIGGETMYAPIDPPIYVPIDEGLSFIRAEFQLADGTLLQGFIKVFADGKFLEGIVVMLDGEEFFSVESPSLREDIPEWYRRELEMYGHEALCRRLSKSVEQVFPIRFRCPVGFEGEEGLIEGEYPMNFRTDRPIKLVRWREHILYEEGKNTLQITWQDLERFPFLSYFWLTNSYVPVNLPAIPKDADKVLTRAEFILADRTLLQGGVKVDTWEKTLLEIMVSMGDRLEGVRSSQQFCEILGKEAREIFPVQFRCFIGFEGEEGVIEGEIPKNFRPDRPVKLSKRRK